MITLLPYDFQWRNKFAAEKILLQQALKDLPLQIEHIGSTAIPGIHAKPVIDILMGVPGLNNFTSAHIQKIESLGYDYLPHLEAEFPHRRYFQKTAATGARTHQIHVVNFPSAGWAKHILFRDYLRAHPDDAKHYEAHKLMLAKQFQDTMAYSIIKNAFCRSIDRKAFADFKLNPPFILTEHLKGYIPQLSCFDLYQTMFQDPDFARCLGVKLTDAELKAIVAKEMNCWDQHAYGPLIWFERETDAFVGKGGLCQTIFNGKLEVELTYSLVKTQWGKGYAKEIGRYAIDVAARQQGLKDIICFTTTTNHASLRIMQHLGFQYECDFIYLNLPHCFYRLK